MTLLRFLFTLAAASLFGAALVPDRAWAEPITVVAGDSNAVNSSGLWTHGVDANHADFYVNATAGWGVNELQSNISSINSHGTIAYLIVAIGTNDAGSGGYADGAAWVADLYSFYTSIRSANPGVKILQFTLGPRTGDSTYTSRRQGINDTLRADEGNGTGADYLIDIAANPTMSSASANSDTNLYINEASIVHYAYCTGTCTVTAPASGARSGDICYGTLGSAKGHSYIMKQVECAMAATRLGRHPWTVYGIDVTYSGSYAAPTTDPPAYTLAQPAAVTTGVTIASWTKQDNITAPLIPPASEYKFRTIMEGNGFAARFDYGRAPGQTIFGDCLQYWGNLQATASTNYTRARALNTTPGASSSAGGPLNMTVYAESCLYEDDALGDGVRRVLKLNDIITYYTVWRTALSMWVPPRGLQYSYGVPPHDPENSIHKALLTTGFTWVSDGFVGWFCESSGENQKYLTNSDGTDAFTTSGGPGGSCPTSSEIYSNSIGPGCWDGVNLRSPTNFDHVMMPIRDQNSGQLICATLFYPIPETENKSFYSHLGTAMIVRLRMDQDATATANSTSGKVYRNGEAFYRTWLGAWDGSIISGWNTFCNRAKTTNSDSFTGHECNNSTYSATDRLLGGIGSENAPDGSRSPQVNGGHSFAGDLAGDWLTYPALAGGGGGGATPGIGNRGRGRLHKKN